VIQLDLEALLLSGMIDIDPESKYVLLTQVITITLKIKHVPSPALEKNQFAPCSGLTAEAMLQLAILSYLKTDSKG
jgi:hypothetical protein